MSDLKQRILELLEQTVNGPDGTCTGCGNKESDVYFTHTPRRATFHAANCPIDLALIELELAALES